MKRLLLSLTLALFAFSGSVNAQETRFNEEALMKKLTKLEADSKDAKKGAKAATWLELGKVYENAATGLTNGLYVGLDSMTTELVFPKPERGVETINGVTYSKWSYPDFDVYLENGVVSFWSVKKVVVEDALAKAAAAYIKGGKQPPCPEGTWRSDASEGRRRPHPPSQAPEQPFSRWTPSFLPRPSKPLHGRP